MSNYRTVAVFSLIIHSIIIHRHHGFRILIPRVDGWVCVCVCVCVCACMHVCDHVHLAQVVAEDFRGVCVSVLLDQNRSSTIKVSQCQTLSKYPTLCFVFQQAAGHPVPQTNEQSYLPTAPSVVFLCPRLSIYQWLLQHGPTDGVNAEADLRDFSQDAARFAFE